jgi:Sec-independent protein secretion pathway component TatC
MSKNQAEGGFFSHLTELRKRLIHSLIFLTILFIICYYFCDYIYGFLVDPYAQAVKNDDLNRRLIFTALQETFLTYLNGFIFCSIFFYQSNYFNSNMEVYCTRTL